MEADQGTVPIREIAMIASAQAIRGMEIQGRDRTIAVVIIRVVVEDQPQYAMILLLKIVLKTERLPHGNVVEMVISDRIHNEDLMSITTIRASEMKAIDPAIIIVEVLIQEGNEIQTAVCLAKRDNRVMRTGAVAHNEHPTFSLSEGNHQEVLTQAAQREVMEAVIPEDISEEGTK